jgi:hypothetical protein
MTHGDTHTPTDPGTATQHFTDAEWRSFRRSDMAAGRNIVVLMSGIFLIGVFLYAIIDVICAA